MKQETVLSVDGTQLVTESGLKTCIGSKLFEVGDDVYTDGPYAFGNERNCSAPVMTGEGDGSVPGKYVIVFTWLGASSGWVTLADGSQDQQYSGDLVCRIYDTTKLDSYTDIATGMNDAAAFCYNAACTKFCWLTANGNTVTIKTLTAAGITTDTVTVTGEGKLTRRHVYAYIGDDGELYWTVWTGAIYNKKYFSNYEKYTNYSLSESTNDALTGKFIQYKGTTLLSTSDYADNAKEAASTMYSQIQSDISGMVGLTLNQENAYAPTLADVQALYPDKKITTADTVWTEENFTWNTGIVYNKLSDMGTYARCPNKPWVYALLYATDIRSRRCVYSITGDGAAYIKSSSGYYLSAGNDYASDGGLLDNSHTKRKGWTYGKQYTKYPAAIDDVQYDEAVELTPDGNTVHYSRKGRKMGGGGTLVVKNRERNFYDSSDTLVATIDDNYTLYTSATMPDTVITGNEYDKSNWTMALDDGYTLTQAGNSNYGLDIRISKGSWSTDISTTYPAQPVATDIDANNVLVVQGNYSVSLIKLDKSKSSPDDYTSILEGNMVYNTAMPLITSKSLYELTTLLQRAKEAS